MRIAFFSTKPYDRIWFEPMAKDYGYEIYFIELPFSEELCSWQRAMMRPVFLSTIM